MIEKVKEKLFTHGVLKYTQPTWSLMSRQVKLATCAYSVYLIKK